MRYIEITTFTPNPERKELAIKLLERSKNISEDVKAGKPYHQKDWEAFEQIFGQDKYTSGYDRLRNILLDIRDNDGAEVNQTVLQQTLLLTQGQAYKVWELSVGKSSPFVDRGTNYGEILSAKMRMFADEFKTKKILRQQEESLVR